jgi:hypothetical protein
MVIEVPAAVILVLVRFRICIARRFEARGVVEEDSFSIEVKNR